MLVTIRPANSERTAIERRTNGERTAKERRTNGERTANERRTIGERTANSNRLLASQKLNTIVMTSFLFRLPNLLMRDQLSDQLPCATKQDPQQRLFKNQASCDLLQVLFLLQFSIFLFYNDTLQKDLINKWKQCQIIK